jgi:hypothetical protein
MPRLGERLAIQQILFVEIDLGEMLFSHLHFHAARGTGGIAPTVMIQIESKRLGSFQQCEVSLDLATLAFRMEKTYSRHVLSSFLCRGARTYSGRLKRTALQPNMLFKFVLEQFEATLYQHRGSCDEGAIAGAFDKPAKLQQ